MPTTEPTTSATSLRDLHSLHQRAKALRDRLVSGPKTLAAREALRASRQAAVDDARKALLEAKAQAKKRELLLQGQQAKSDELKVKLNSVKKNEEYKAIQNQLAHDKASMGKLEDEILEGYESINQKEKDLGGLEAEVKTLTSEVAALKADLESKADSQKAQLAELETSITDAEAIIPADQREQYRRVVKQRGADALAAAEEGACTGCFVSVTAQMVNELINGHHMVFCKTCGRVLYLAEEDRRNTRRTVS
jgi:predicted  nucleic acid-binding Zn-ribbon protein